MVYEEGEEEERYKDDFMVSDDGKKKENKLFLSFLCMFRLSGYIEYLKIASCSAFKFPFSLAQCRYMPAMIFSHTQFFLPFIHSSSKGSSLHILRIKRKFVSYLLCFNGGFSWLRVPSFLSPSHSLFANIIKKENLFL